MDFEPVKNHYIGHGLPYNKVVIHVFAYDIPNTITFKEVSDYFSMFGSIRRIHLLPQYKTPTRQIAFIEFENGRCISKSVCGNYCARSVFQRNHFLRTKKIQVQAFNGWNHFGNLTIWKRTLEDGSETHIHTAPIFGLNFDCLELVLNHLNTRDRISFARTCDKFYEMFSEYAKLKYKVVQVNDLRNLSLYDSRTLFELAGSNIEKIESGYRCSFPVQFLKFVPNLKTLSLYKIDLRDKILSEFIGKLNVLSFVILENCNIDEGTIMEFSKLPSLEKLYISFSYEFTGENLHLLTKLKELKLNYCRNVQNRFFIELCKSLKNLTLLDLEGCFKLQSDAFNEIGKQLTNLETLRITCREAQCESIADLPKLKNLMIYEDLPKRSDLLVALAEKRFNELENLEIESEYFTIDDARMIAKLINLKQLHFPYCSNLNDDCLREFGRLKKLEVFNTKSSNITNTGLRHLAQNCPKLKLLNIGECKNITNEFVFDLIKIRQQSEGLLTLYAAESGIDDSIFNNPKYVAASAVLKVKFEYCDDF